MPRTGYEPGEYLEEPPLPELTGAAADIAAVIAADIAADQRLRAVRQGRVALIYSAVGAGGIAALMTLSYSRALPASAGGGVLALLYLLLLLCCCGAALGGATGPAVGTRMGRAAVWVACAGVAVYAMAPLLWRLLT